jgi:hypothetical protein
MIAKGPAMCQGKRPTNMSNIDAFTVDASDVATGINIRPMAAAMRPYSIAVAPLLSRRKSFARYFAFFIMATLHKITSGIVLHLSSDLFLEC